MFREKITFFTDKSASSPFASAFSRVISILGVTVPRCHRELKILRPEGTKRASSSGEFFSSHQHTWGLVTRASQVSGNEALGACHRVCCICANASARKKCGVGFGPGGPCDTDVTATPCLVGGDLEARCNCPPVSQKEAARGPLREDSRAALP